MNACTLWGYMVNSFYVVSQLDDVVHMGALGMLKSIKNDLYRTKGLRPNRRTFTRCIETKIYRRLAWRQQKSQNTSVVTVDILQLH